MTTMLIGRRPRSRPPVRAVGSCEHVVDPHDRQQFAPQADHFGVLDLGDQLADFARADADQLRAR